MNDISFKSYIKFCNNTEFAKETSSISKKYFVDFPWTIKQTVSGKDAYTKDIIDCTILGIADKSKVLLFHLSPNDTSNWNKRKITKMIKDKFDFTDNNVQGIVLGSKPNSKYSPLSSAFFDYIKSIPEMLKIGYSSFKGGNYANDIAYNGEKDTWFISNELMDNGVFCRMTADEKAKFIFDKSNLSKTDNFIE